MVFGDAVLSILRSRGVVAASIAGTTGYIVYNDNTRYTKIAGQFTKGNLCGPHSTYETCYFPRPKLEDKLHKILTSDFTHSYYIINGEVGCGKTRSLVEVTKKLINTNGKKKLGAPVYVLVSQGSTFAETLAESVGFNFDEHISFQFLLSCVLQINSMPSNDEKQKIQRVLQAVENAAFSYKHKHGRPAVLLIDGVDMLLQRGETGREAVQKLQHKAKLWADTNVCKVILVVNTKRCMDLLQEDKSSWARASEPVTVGDLTESESIQYLTSPKLFETDHTEGEDRHGIDTVTAARVHKLVGGRLQHLKYFKHLYSRGSKKGDFNAVSSILISKEREKFSMVCRDSNMWRGIQILLKAPQMTVPVSELVNKTSYEALDNLDEHDITRLQSSRMGTLVKFHSPLTAHVALDMDDNYRKLTSLYPTTFWTKLQSFLIPCVAFAMKKPRVTADEVRELLEGE